MKTKEDMKTEEEFRKMKIKKIIEISGIDTEVFVSSVVAQSLILVTMGLWVLFYILDLNIFFTIIPLLATFLCVLFLVFIAGEFGEFHGPIACFKFYKLKKYKHFRQLFVLHKSQCRLQEWLNSQERSETKEQMQNSLCKFDDFIINGFKMDYLARMIHELKKDTNLLNVKVFDDDITYEDVENYLINGMKDTTEMDRIYAELDKRYGI